MRIARLARFGWPVLCLFQFGLLVGIWCLGPGPEPRRDPEAAAAPRPPSPSPSGKAVEKKGATPLAAPPRRSPPTDFRRGDELVRQGKYQLALAAYPPPTADAGAALGQLNYRLALCLEGVEVGIASEGAPGILALEGALSFPGLVLVLPLWGPRCRL